MSARLHVVVGGQFGSEGKGAIVGHLAMTEARDTLVIRVGGPNAGHTVYDPQGRRFAMRQIPVGFVNPRARLAIGPGSEISYAELWREAGHLEGAGYEIRNRLFIDPSATVLEPKHTQQGEEQRRRGSTGKGVGVARAARVRRFARTVRDWDDEWPGKLGSVADLARNYLRNGRSVIVEGTQGYGLGLHTWFYPYTTSGDCTAMDMLAQAGICAWSTHNLQVWVVLRTHPIRVAGSSGPMYDETSWEELNAASNGHIQPEYTTVTHKVRRVGHWDEQLAADAVQANGGPPVVRAALTMFDYWYPEVAGAEHFPESWPGTMMRQRLDKLEAEIGCRIELVGTSPHSVIDRRP